MGPEDARGWAKVNRDPNTRKGKAVPVDEERRSVHVKSNGSELIPFFTGRAVSGSAFVGRLRQSVLRIPPEKELAAVAEAVVSRKGGFSRLLSLLQAVGQQPDSVHDSILRLAEFALRQTALSPVSGIRGADYVKIGLDWLSGLPKKRLPASQRDFYVTFVLWGWRKRALGEERVSELLRAAFLPQARRKSAQSEEPTRPQNPVEVLLCISNSRGSMKGIMSLMSVWEGRAQEAQEIIARSNEAKSAAESKRDELAHSLVLRKSEVARLQDRQADLMARLQGMESQNVDLETKFQHRIDEVRGRLRGILEGSLSRGLENAYEASIAEPPRTKVIRERLEMAIAAIRREAEWLRTLE